MDPRRIVEKHADKVARPVSEEIDLGVTSKDDFDIIVCCIVAFVDESGECRTHTLTVPVPVMVEMGRVAT